MDAGRGPYCGGALGDGKGEGGACVATGFDVILGGVLHGMGKEMHLKENPRTRVLAWAPTGEANAPIIRSLLPPVIAYGRSRASEIKKGGKVW